MDQRVLITCLLIVTGNFSAVSASTASDSQDPRTELVSPDQLRKLVSSYGVSKCGNQTDCLKCCKDANLGCPTLVSQDVVKLVEGLKAKESRTEFWLTTKSVGPSTVPTSKTWANEWAMRINETYKIDLKLPPCIREWLDHCESGCRK